MPVFGKFIDGALYKGGILATGIACLYLTKYDYLPRYMDPISYGLTSLGIFGVLIGLNMEDDEDEDPHYEERMEEFRRLKPMLEEKIKERERLAAECEYLKLRWFKMDELEQYSKLITERIDAYRKRMKDLGVVEIEDDFEYLKAVMAEEIPRDCRALGLRRRTTFRKERSFT